MLWLLVIIVLAAMTVTCIIGAWKGFIIATMVYVTLLFVIRLVWEKNNK